MGAAKPIARRLFDGIAPAYDLPAEIFSFAQYGRWRRFAVSRLALPRGALVLDVATGTGLVARDLARRGSRVVGIDQSAGMLAAARARSGFAVAGAEAERLPFPDEMFHGLTFTYLLRYVEDPAATITEMARVLKPGAPMASVEFGVPRGGITGPLWRLYALGVFPFGARLVSRGWREVGEFLGRSIAGFSDRLPPEDLADLWRKAGIEAVRIRRVSFGAGVVTWGRKSG